MMDYQPYKSYCEQLQHTGKYRTLPGGFPSSHINFSTNDYLGLSKHPHLIAAAHKAAQEEGVGATGSRLLSGNSQRCEAFEARIAADKKTAAALIFNTGFQANFTVLASLLENAVLPQKSLVFFDRLNHSSLYQAIKLSGAEMIRYRHNDMNHLADLLKKWGSAKRSLFVVTETIFSMDGDLLPLKDLVLLCQQYQVFLYLDEAHATGIIGPRGYGLSTTVDLSVIPHLIMGTFSKALGCLGAYAALHPDVKDYLINKAPGFIYSTALPPPLLAAAFTSWEKISFLEKEREHVCFLADYLRQNLKQLGWDTGLSAISPIIPIFIGKEEKALSIKNKLLEKGILVSAIRPPTVPPGTSRLRITLCCNHQVDDLNYLLNSLQNSL
jgi:8-amino-7-oxononanoate synthase